MSVNKSHLREFSHNNNQIKAYEAIVVFIYSFGGVIYYLQALYAPNIIGPAPYLFSGFVVHWMIIISFVTFTIASYRIIKKSFITLANRKEFKEEFRKILVGFSIGFSSSIFGIDSLDLIRGLIIIFLIPVLFTLILYFRYSSSKSPKTILVDRPNYIKNFKEQNNRYTSSENFSKSVYCKNCGGSNEMNSIFCDQCGNRIQ